MSWWGKVLGGTFGFVLGGPLGALLGGVVGHQFDKGLQGLREEAEAAADIGTQARTQTAFFTATFSVMGHVAKADGRVSEEEIEMARAVMAQMDLPTQMRQAAIKLFTEGKQPGFPLDDVLDQLRRECHRRYTLLQIFIEIQIHAAYADGIMDPAERDLLVRICDRLGFSRRDFERLESMIRAERHGGAGPGRRPTATGPSLVDAYAILNVPEKATEGEVKKAYRRLMNQHHPDKLVAKGLPEEMMRLATEKTREIKAAYERIRKDRGF
jgi:DnaJ like chaperone protein